MEEYLTIYDEHAESSPRDDSLTCWHDAETVVICREDEGYGFTIRYLIEHPPLAVSSDGASEKDFDSVWLEEDTDNGEEIIPNVEVSPPVGTFYVKTVKPGSSAEHAGLRSGDCIVSINGDPVEGKTYKDVIELIQYCTGNLEVKVSPRDDDILQLVCKDFYEDLYDDLSVTESDLPPKQMYPPPSVNKWAVSLTPRKSVSSDGSEGPLDRIHSNSISSNVSSVNGATPETEKKYESCVKFIAGTPVNIGRQSRSSSMSSSGSITPMQRSGRVSPVRKASAPGIDPCVSFTAGKPNVGSIGEAEEPPMPSVGVQAHKLENALKKAQNKRGYSVGTRLAPKPIEIPGVSKPGSVNSIKGIFAGGNTDSIKPSNTVLRKQSATCVLRDDFQIRSCKNKVTDKEDDEPSKVKLNLNPDKRKLSEQDLPPVPKRVDKKNSVPSRQFTSSTSQATLVESETQPCNEEASCSLVPNTIWKDDQKDDKHSLPPCSPVTLRKRNLLGTERKASIPSSVENSDDDMDSHVDSADESELNNWKDRRRSYLAAKSKQSDKVALNSGAPMDTDDEDSDANMGGQVREIAQKALDETDAPVKSKVIKEGPLNRKLERSYDRRKASTRTWKPIYAVLKGHRLFCYKEGGDADDEIILPIPVRSSIIEIASDYYKRKNVFRMVTSHKNEYLFQAETAALMTEWVAVLREANPDKESLLKTTANMKLHEYESGHSPPSSKPSSMKERRGLSIRKGTFSFGSKPKGVHHKVRLPDEPLERIPGKTFGTTLSRCPLSPTFKNVPLILDRCCCIIEEKGINQTGLYRVPGNAAAMTSLKEELDTKEPEDVDWEDEKWQELNNICSLLKQFLRELEEPIIPINMYSTFIQAIRCKDPTERYKNIKQLVWSLPEYHLETLNFLIHHLKELADNSDKNLMTERNIAMIHAPNIVRTSEVCTMVQDMSDQYQIVEMLIRQCEWVFDDNGDSCSVPEEGENSSENIIGSNIKQNLLETLNSQNDADNENGKKGVKFSNLKFNNFSIRLRNNSKSNSSPKGPKKSKGGSLSATDDDIESEGYDDVSDTSPVLESKNDTDRSTFFKNKEPTSPVFASPLRRSSYGGPSKVGSYQQNTDHQSFSKHRSPEISPQPSRSDNFKGNITLSEKTLQRLNQLSVHRHDEHSKRQPKDDDDSELISQQRMDSDDNLSVHSDNSTGRKASLDSLSGPSPLTPRRYMLKQQQGGGVPLNNGDRSPASQKNSTSKEPNDWQKRAENNQVVDENFDNKSTVIKRNRGSGRNQTTSPRVSKRGIVTIKPGDDIEEKVRALIDPKYSGQMKDEAQSELNKDSGDISLKSEPTSPRQNHGSNVDWWLSDNKIEPRREIIGRPRDKPKDKLTALSIISNAIDQKRRTDTRTNNIDTSNDKTCNRSPLLSPTMTRRIGTQKKLPYKPELSGRVDHYNQQKEECQKKVDGVLGSNENEYDSRSNLSVDTKTEQIQFYLEQVSKLLNEKDSDGDSPQIGDLLKQFQSKHVSPSDSSVRERNGNLPFERRTSNPTSSKISRKPNERTSPLLDSTYSNLDYSKFYGR